MSELRQDPITKEWVILATERAKRPEELRIERQAKPAERYVDSCPFCPGNESRTPDAVLELPREGEETWQVRVVPNKFPALSREGALARRSTGAWHRVSGVGIHEVIVETPDHSLTPALLPAGDVARILEAYRARFDAVSADPRIAQVTLFKNHGAGSGTSLEHPHSQLIATPIISSHLRAREYEALRHYDDFGACLLCQILQQEIHEKKRLVLESEHFTTLEPFASRVSFHTHIYPRRHMASFGEVTKHELEDLAGHLKTVLAKLYWGLGNPDFNYTIHSAPAESAGVRYYHWYLSIIPRLTQMAGFELGSGMSINTVLPEAAAEFLRHVTLGRVEKPARRNSVHAGDGFRKG